MEGEGYKTWIGGMIITLTQQHPMWVAWRGNTTDGHVEINATTAAQDTDVRKKGKRIMQNWKKKNGSMHNFGE